MLRCAGVLLVSLLTSVDGLAELRFSQPVIDAGEIKTGPAFSRRFALSNDGSETVQILDIRTSCGCMKPRWEKRLYQPGEQGEIPVDVNTLTQPPGPHNWPLIVTYRSGPVTHETILQVKATLVTEVT